MTATAAGGTHPTGMHTCIKNKINPIFLPWQCTKSVVPICVFILQRQQQRQTSKKKNRFRVHFRCDINEP